ncbi:MAG: repair protein RadC [Candidatus Saccharibacteria bacterium]|nr:repair protein RadC [Candidatus Saccharibacteria bacterium]MDB5181222.1 repair protein RadC [Candidatus Saccharibacteria bacterium]
MDTNTYERPREKLYQKGVSALSNTELLQVIIGSGNAGMPVTKIARKVDKLLRVNGVAVSLTDLMAIKGLGLVKAGQLVAGLELAARLAYQEANQEYKDMDIMSDLFTDIRTAKKRTLLYAFFDGNGRLIDDYTEAINSKVNTTRLAKKVFAEALAQSAVSVVVAIGGDAQPVEPTMFELNLARDIYSTATLLSINVKSFVLVGVSEERNIKEASRG